MTPPSAWRTLTGECSELYAPFGLRPVDDYTGNAPLGWLQTKLDVSDDSGGWRETEVKPVVTARGILTFPA